jgi:hypothetical protein
MLFSPVRPLSIVSPICTALSLNLDAVVSMLQKLSEIEILRR